MFSSEIAFDFSKYNLNAVNLTNDHLQFFRICQILRDSVVSIIVEQCIVKVLFLRKIYSYL